MDKELKPCPFCGWNASYSYTLPLFNEDLRYQVICIGCNASTSQKLTMDDAIEAWNRRVNDE